MNRDMKQWVGEVIAAPKKRPLPILSFPAASLLGVSVKELCTDSSLMVKVMELVVEKTDAPAVISLMDLSVEAEAFGAEILFEETEIPTVVGALITDEEEADALAVPPVGAARTGLYLDAVEQAAKSITDRPVLAGAIGPYSLAGRLLDVSEAMILCYEEPDMVHTVMEKTTAFLIDYIRAYKSRGADGVLLAEPLTGMLSPKLAAEFSAPYVKQIVEAVQDDNFLVIYHNCGDNVEYMADTLVSCGAGAYHFGNACVLKNMIPHVPGECLIMGNVDPAGQICGGTPDSIKAAVDAVMDDCSHAPNFLLSSGCDIPPQTSWDNIAVFFEAADNYGL